MKKNVVIACGMQKAYFSKKGRKYLGENVDTLNVRIQDYLQGLNKGYTEIFLVREVHQTNDTFYSGTSSYALVGTDDIEIPEVFKPYAKVIINSSRPSAFYRTPLESELHKVKPDNVYLIGLETHTNILFTAEELRNREYNVTVYEQLVMSEDDYLNDLGINILSNVLSVRVE